MLAYLGHAGTIAFFSWWLIHSFHISSRIGLDVIAPLDWGMKFELVFVGAWVWITATVMHGQPARSAGFVALSVVKAASFWFAFIAFLTDEKWMIVLRLGAVTFVTGPLWHLWIRACHAIDFVRQRYRGPIVLFGNSLGAMVAILVGARDVRPVAVAVANCPAHIGNFLLTRPEGPSSP